jgi:hypothetical protein
MASVGPFGWDAQAARQAASETAETTRGKNVRATPWATCAKDFEATVRFSRVRNSSLIFAAKFKSIHAIRRRAGYDLGPNIARRDRERELALRRDRPVDGISVRAVAGVDERISRTSDPWLPHTGI